MSDVVNLISFRLCTLFLNLSCSKSSYFSSTSVLVYAPLLASTAATTAKQN